MGCRLLASVAGIAGSVLVVVLTMLAPGPVLLRIAHVLPWRLEPAVAVALAQAVLLALVLGALRVTPASLIDPVGLRAGRRAAAWFLAMTFVFSLLVASAVVPAEGGNAAAVLSRWKANFPATGLIGRFALFVVVIPLIEELVFRGVILGRLLRTAPAWAGLAVSSALFAVGHDSWVLSGFIGLGLGLLYLRFLDIRLCVLVHGAHNLFSSAAAPLLVAHLHDRGLSMTPGPWTLPVQLAGFAVVLLCLAMFLRHVFGRIEGEQPMLLGGGLRLGVRRAVPTNTP